MLKRLWLILGPVFCALILVFSLIMLYPAKGLKHNYTAEKNDAVALSPASFKNTNRKVRSLSDKKHEFVPFFGSSEWKRFDSMHPSILAERYKRSYRPYLLGQKGTTSLSHYFGMQQISRQLQGKKAVYVISPQWFVKKGTNAAAFQQYFSSEQLVDFLLKQTGNASDQYAAKRLLKIKPDISMSSIVKKVANGKKLSSFDRIRLRLTKTFLKKEEALFGHFDFNSDYAHQVEKRGQKLPKAFSYKKLEQIATHDAEMQTKSNPFAIKDSFYKKRIKGQYHKLKGFQKHLSYLKSPEYNDLQLSLTQLAASKTNAIFVIPPVNSKWVKYTGLNQKLYQKTVQKIKYQLQSQGFTNIADLSKDGHKPYFMQDTIHLGWNGWLAFDKAVRPFLTEKQKLPHYTINDNFLSQKWAQYAGDPAKF
ncbi:D-alanyl-lipoteichoic acid biosynthesis protein DltD [Streptococcus macacae]|uniref:Protein DltD n=1 Tax=Streptococcus macacae NCTC 11558 TaxID=764298 RepID=G5JYB1_9STRE|nr:D-alanyl-lipoteichoic acid biosynthesis protein DltD [Streptococcus macacae]EHJ52904.1 D-alanyl-lipoteichoic acid biosynthesis protein DltD [Streptococcus macacae NCTC 11558]SUN78025.1 putative extramembranal protein DltD [Streptococcus macacae NCTC 11558]